MIEVPGASAVSGADGLAPLAGSCPLSPPATNRRQAKNAMELDVLWLAAAVISVSWLRYRACPERPL